MTDQYAAEGKVFAACGVEAFPTNYLLDSQGSAVYRSAGFDETGL